MDSTCKICKREGFKWNKNTCFYCGAYDESRIILSEANFRSKFGNLCLNQSNLTSLPSAKAAGILCSKCGREGFVWNRSHCSYCGYISEDIKTRGIDSERLSNDRLYDETMKYSKILKQRSHNSKPDTSGGDYSNGYLGDYSVGNDCTDSLGTCNDS